MKLKHGITFSTFGEKYLLSYPSNSEYDLTVINANTAVLYPGGISSFLVEKGLRFFVMDPMTHAFQHDPGKISRRRARPEDAEGAGVKKAFQKLAKELGSPFFVDGRVRRVLPSDFESDHTVLCVVRNCLGFQQKTGPEMAASHSDFKYVSDEIDALPPFALVAPYLMVTIGNRNEVLSVNKRFIDQSLKLSDQGIFAFLVIDKDVLQENNYRQQVIDTYTSISGLSAIMIWIDGFDETTASIAELISFCHLTLGLRKACSEVLNLHGGFFSIASGSLDISGLSGVVHGPGYGDSREIVPVGGGVPASKYYLPGLHKRLHYRQVLNYILMAEINTPAEFHNQICSCNVCRSVVVSNIDEFSQFGEADFVQPDERSGKLPLRVPTGRAKSICAKHFLECRAKEFLLASSMSLIECIHMLEQAHSTLYRYVEDEELVHLLKWKHFFEQARSGFG